MSNVKRCYGRFHESEQDKMVPIERFGKNKSAKDGLAYMCKTCVSLDAKERRNNSKTCQTLRDTSRRYYQRNKPEFAERQRKSRLTERGFRGKMFTQARCRARDSGIDFNITIADIIIPNTCPVLGIPLRLTGTKTDKNNSPSLDRIDSLKGYTKDNILVVSWRANKLKSDSTVEELTKLYEFYANDPENT